jgi:hypothetical protein
MDRARLRSHAAGAHCGHMSRSQRNARDSAHLWLMIAALVSVAVGSLLNAIAPKEKPVVTIYMRPDCGSCVRWLEYLEARGFRTEIGHEADWPSIRKRFGIAPELRSSHTAVVNGLFIEGPVPAADIHRALRLQKLFHVRGLIVPGVPRWSPGIAWGLPEPYTVLVMREGGRVHEFAEHNH